MSKRESDPGIGPMRTSLLLLALLLSGCAATREDPPDSRSWTPDQAWWIAAGDSGGELLTPTGSIRRVDAVHARNLYEVSRKIREQSGVAADIVLVDSRVLNAFATEVEGERRIALTLEFLQAIGDDRDALATSIGHEAAHLYYRHAATRKKRNQPIIGTASAIAGIIAVDTSFSRYEEREADVKGMEWAVAAGFSPCGSARTLRMLEARARVTGSDPFLATHPDHGERIARANALSRKLTGSGC